MHIIIRGTAPWVLRLPRVRELSREAWQRLKCMDHYKAQGNGALTCRYFGISRQSFYRLTCRYFGISRQSFYRWKGRYNPRDLTSLEERSRRPKRLLQPTWSLELALVVLHLWEQYPRWGKD